MKAVKVGIWAFAFGAGVLGCGDAADPQDSTGGPTAPATAASFVLGAIILGPVASDDDADLRVTLTESAGVGARINFLRLMCSNGTVREWGAGKIASIAGSNRASGSADTILVVHYLCPSSSRPRELLGDLVDDHGFRHQISTSPFHPDWPGT